MEIPYCNLTTGDVAQVISQDAQDTINNLVTAYEPLSVLASAYLDDGVIDAEEEEELVELFASFPDNAISIVDAEGDIICIKIVRETLPPETTPVLTIYSGYGEGGWEKIFQGGRFFNGFQFRDSAGDLHSVESLMASVAEQLQASEVMRRLADLASTGDVNLEKVIAGLSDIAPNMSASVGSLYNTICANGPSLNSSTLVSMLKQVYTQGFTGATTSEDDKKIEFSKDTFTVSAFYGTVIKGIVTSAAQALVTIVGTAVGGVGWILQSVGSLVLSGISAVRENFDKETKATFNYDPSAYCFAKPLWQGTITATDAGTDVTNALMAYGPALIKFPFFDIFAWDAGGGRINMEMYNNLLITGNLKSIQALNATRTMFKAVTSDADVVSLYCSIDKKPDIGQGVLPVRYFPYTEIAQYNTPYGSPQLYSYVPMSVGVSDDEMRRRVWASCATSIWWLLNVLYHVDDSLFTQGEDGFKVSETPLYGTDDWSGDYAILAYHVFRWINDDITPSWSEIVDTIIPVMRRELLDKFISANWLAMFSRGQYAGLSSATYWVRPAGNFRHSFAVTPPAYSEGALINAVLATAALTAVAGAAAFGVSRVKRSITKRLTRMQGEAQTLYSAYTNPESEHYHDEAYLNAYLKKAKSANLLSSLTGRSALLPSSVASGNAVVGTTTPASITELIQGLNSDVTGETDDDGVTRPLSLEDVVLLIRGPAF